MADSAAGAAREFHKGTQIFPTLLSQWSMIRLSGAAVQSEHGDAHVYHASYYGPG